MKHISNCLCICSSHVLIESTSSGYIMPWEQTTPHLIGLQKRRPMSCSSYMSVMGQLQLCSTPCLYMDLLGGTAARQKGERHGEPLAGSSCRSNMAFPSIFY